MNDPTCEAILFADKAIRENNGKHGLIGIFEKIHLRQFPSAKLMPWYVFLVVRNLAEGTHDFAFNLIREDANQVLVPVNGEINVREARSSVSLVIPVPPVSFPKPGSYTATVHLDGSYLVSKELVVLEAPQNPPKA